jgi:hypothetical protein
MINYKYYFIWENNDRQRFLENILKKVDEYSKLIQNNNNLHEINQRKNILLDELMLNKSKFDDIFMDTGTSNYFEYSSMGGYFKPRDIHILDGLDDFIKHNNGNGREVRNILLEVIGRLKQNRIRSWINLIFFIYIIIYRILKNLFHSLGLDLSLNNTINYIAKILSLISQILVIWQSIYIF